MSSKSLLLLVTAISGLAVVSTLQAQSPNVEFPAASPACTLKQHVGLTDITVVYSRPSVKGRTVYGGIVPFGEVWRTGANQATKITFSTPVKLEGNEIPAGTYALFTIPGEQEWTIIISKNTNQWGAFQYKTNDDLVRFKVAPARFQSSLTINGGVSGRGPIAHLEPVETFTIDINDIRDDSATLNLVWERTRVPIHLTVDVTDKVVPQIEAAMAAPGKKSDGFYFQAATFYFNHDLDSKKALEWVNAGLADNSRISYEMLHLKAQILAKQGDKAGAIDAAKQSSELAVKAEGPGSSFVKMNDDLISSQQ